MNILVLNWKDIRHPQAGGAELVLHEILVKLVKNGYKVTLLTAQYRDSKMYDLIDGIDIIRISGGRTIHSFKTITYYRKHLRDKFDIIIEQVNTAPYFIGFFTKKERVFQIYHQLAREIWFYEMGKIMGAVGYIFLEPVALFLQAFIANIKKIRVITISESTKKDVTRFGFKEKNITIISEGIENKPLKSLKDSQPKESQFTVLFHSSLRKMKRPLEVFKAFGHLLSEQPETQLWISGGGDQTELREYAELNGFLNSVTFYGRTTDEEKFDLMQRSHVLCSTSIKEGWGLIVSEANSMGTPAISYDVDGLRDSTKFGGGVVCDANPESMAEELKKIALMVQEDEKMYLEMRKIALESSKSLTFDRCYDDFIDAIK
jgi:glycosyltransferase involved in cell wall biosynthesis